MFMSLTGLCVLITVSALFFILGYLIWNGGKDLSWNFFTRLPAPVGEEGGGMANAIVGSLKLLLLATIFGVPTGLLGGVYLAEFGGRTLPFMVRYVADLMNGVPSIGMGNFCLRTGRDAHASFLDAGRRNRAGDHGNPHGAAQH